jgi:hypothetical protein
VNEGNTDIETGKPGTDPAGTAETGTDSGKETPKAGTQAPAAMTPETVTALVQKMLQDFTAKQQAQQSEAEKLAGMNGTQRLEYERDSYKDQLAQLQKQMNLAQMQDTARGMLAEKNIHAADGLLAAIVTEDAETTKKNVEQFAQLFSDAVEAAVKERLRSSTPKAGTPAGKMTKEQIFAIADADERIEAIRSNMDLFQ